MEKIAVIENTYLKQSFRHQASELSEDNRVALKRGSELPIVSIGTAPNKHIKIVLAEPLKGIRTWYGFKHHLALGDVEELEETKLPQLPKPITDYRFDSHTPILWNNFNQKIGQFFTVGEILRNDTRRIPQLPVIKENIFKIVRELDAIRRDWGSPIGITSGYRPPLVNKQVGGVRNSQHLSGNAVDVFPLNGMTRQFEQFLDENWFGRLGYGQRARRGFTHLDILNGKGWKSGGQKGIRWDY